MLAEAFQRYDGDASGALDRHEIERALEDLDIPGDEIFVDSLFAQLDKNKDGTIELREWLDNLPRGTRLKIAAKFAPGSALDEYRAVRFQVPTASIVYTYVCRADFSDESRRRRGLRRGYSAETSRGHSAETSRGHSAETRYGRAKRGVHWRRI